MKRLRIGTRGSALALRQADAVARALSEQAGREAEIVPIATAGDRPGGQAGSDPVSPPDKSRFVKEIEEALLHEEVDLGVHSAKDVPGTLPGGLELVGAAAPEDPRDAIVGGARSLDELPAGARVGTSSIRRRSQLLATRPDLAVLELRGNVDTRLAKLDTGDYDAIVLALAGLRRLGLAERAAVVLDPEVFVPAPGQGLLVLEAREGNSDAASAAAAVSDAAAGVRLEAERALVRALDASCHTPLGAHARVEGRALELRAYVGLPDGTEWIGDRLEGDPQGARSLGRELAERMRAAGAGELLQRAQEAG